MQDIKLASIIHSRMTGKAQEYSGEPTMYLLTIRYFTWYHKLKNNNKMQQINPIQG